MSGRFDGNPVFDEPSQAYPWISRAGFSSLTVMPDGYGQTTCPNAGFTIVERKASNATRRLKTAEGTTLNIRREMIITTSDVTEIKLIEDYDHALVQIKFTPEAATRLNAATTNDSGIRIAFVSDQTVLNAVTWQGEYGMDAELGIQLSLRNGVKRTRPVVEAMQKCISERK